MLWVRQAAVWRLADKKGKLNPSGESDNSLWGEAGRSVEAGRQKKQVKPQRRKLQLAMG